MRMRGSARAFGLALWNCLRHASCECAAKYSTAASRVFLAAINADDPPFEPAFQGRPIYQSRVKETQTPFARLSLGPSAQIRAPFRQIEGRVRIGRVDKRAPGAFADFEQEIEIGLLAIIHEIERVECVRRELAAQDAFERGGRRLRIAA